MLKIKDSLRTLENDNLFSSWQVELNNLKKDIQNLNTHNENNLDKRRSIISDNTRTKSISNNKWILGNVDSRTITPIKKSFYSNNENSNNENNSIFKMEKSFKNDFKIFHINNKTLT